MLSNRRCPLVLTLALVMACVLGAPAAGAAGSSTSSGQAQCSDVSVPVDLAQGQPAAYRIYGRLCVPSGGTSHTIEVLVPGITYTHIYWSFPDSSGQTDRYNFTAAANAAGYATLAIDRIGTGQSSHPIGALVTIDSNAWTVHQVIQAIRAGQVTAPGGSRFSKIVYVGHSYGSWTGWYEVSEFNDVDAFVITGATHHINTNGYVAVLPNLYPAGLDPAFASLSPDPTYLTSAPGKRNQMFYAPAAVDPAVLSYDEAHKSTVTASELDNLPLIILHPLDIRVPSLLVDGALDGVFCGADAGGADCSSTSRLIASEAPDLGSHVPSIGAYILPGAGHDLNMALDAPDYFAATQQWITGTVGGAAQVG